MENYHLGGNHSKRNTINTENFCKTLKNKGFAEGGLERLIPFSHLANNFRNAVFRFGLLFCIRSIQLTNATRLGIKWTLTN